MAADQRLTTGHVGINVTDLNRSLEFYRRVFGFQVMRESREAGRRFAFLGDDKRLVLTLWQQASAEFDAHRSGLHHLSFEVATPEALADVEGRLRALGVPLIYDGIVPHAEGSDSAAVFFQDPDGTRLEVYSPSGGKGRRAPRADAPSCGFF